MASLYVINGVSVDVQGGQDARDLIEHNLPAYRDFLVDISSHGFITYTGVSEDKDTATVYFGKVLNHTLDLSSENVSMFDPSITDEEASAIDQLSDRLCALLSGIDANLSVNGINRGIIVSFFD